MKKNEISVTYMGKMKNAYRILFGKLHGPIGRVKR
jgi:hypothetical protein